jgi:hypothetical protein
MATCTIGFWSSFVVSLNSLGVFGLRTFSAGWPNEFRETTNGLILQVEKWCQMVPLVLVEAITHCLRLPIAERPDTESRRLQACCDLPLASSEPTNPSARNLFYANRTLSPA